MLASYFRDVLSAAVMGPARVTLVNVDRREEILGLAEQYPAEKTERALALLLDVRQAIERNANSQLALDVLFTQLTMPT